MSLRKICLLLALSLPAMAQASPTRPVYRITIVQRTTPAINYGHRTEPTKIDFKGTPLLPQANGDATVQNKNGATMVDAHFNNVPPPSRFGPQYLTYVVWSISPEGRPQNLGELILNNSDKGHVVATTPMQTFALIVTAEPYYSVSQPSDVVVMENEVRPDTVGQVQPVNATYELLPRKEYTYNIAAQSPVPIDKGLPASEYEALVATYEAKNAIQIANAAGADRYASEKLKRAQKLYAQASQIPRKTLGDEVVSRMREVAQVAEDARAISVQRAEQEQAAQAQAQVAQQKEAQQAADAAAAQAQADAERRDAETARRQAEVDRQNAERAAAQAEQARRELEAQQQNAQRAAQADRLMPREPETGRETRASLRSRLSGSGFQTLDTPRGLVVVIPNSLIESAPEAVNGRLSTVASAIGAYPGLRVEVDGNAEDLQTSQVLATRVRDMLVGDHVDAGSVKTIGYGNTHPTASDQNAVGRQQNRRVEVVISGDAIGTMPVWDRPYTLDRRPQPR